MWIVRLAAAGALGITRILHLAIHGSFYPTATTKPIFRRIVRATVIWKERDKDN
jgi:hypothetical protein